MSADSPSHHLCLQDYLWNQPHSTRSLGRDFRLRHGAGHGIIAAANAAQHHPGHLAAAGRSRSLGAGINREESLPDDKLLIRTILPCHQVALGASRYDIYKIF